ncbi:MAG: MFS transporter [Proteobacteria bacterium]|nr:MFS transporter [Pseudomonadota bacterium]
MINPKSRPCDEGTIRSVATDPVCARQRPWILVVTILGSAMAYIDESVVNVALPVIEADLQASIGVMQWLINAYTLSLAALVLIGGGAGDRFGRRLVFVTGVAIFAAASLWCGFAPDTAQLILARAVQGAGAALLIPCSLALIGASFDEAERGKAIGTWAGVSAIAAAVGPLLGGWIVDHASWRWIFLINPFVALPAIWIALRHVPESRAPAAAGGLDWPGALLAFAGLGSLVFGLIAASEHGWRDATAIATVAAGVLLLAAFVWVERRSKSPMMPLDLFRSRNFNGVNILTLLLYAALAGCFFFLPFDLMQVHGYSATLAGAVFLPFTIIMGGLSRWSGGLLDRFGARLPLVVGPAIAALGFALLAMPGGGGAYWTTFLIPIATLGFGMAASVAPLSTSVINAVPSDQAGVASGVNNAVASVASLLAVAIFGAVALDVYHRAIDRRLATQTVSAEVKRAVEAARGKFLVEAAAMAIHGEDRRATETILREALAEGVGLAMLLAAALALGGAVASAVAIRADRPAPRRSG